MARQTSYTPLKCLQIARRYSTKRKWHEKAHQSYVIAKRDAALYEKCTAHMEDKLTYWTLEDCCAEASKHPTVRAWSLASSGSYKAARDNEGWLDKCKECFIPTQKVRGYDECKEAARNFKTKSEWQKGDGKTYMKAYRKKWVNQIMQELSSEREDDHPEL